MNEIEKLKAENKRLREYADFKRDLKSWKTWLKASPFIAVIGWALFRDPGSYGDSLAKIEELIGRANTDILISIAVGAFIAGPIFQIPHVVRWWMKRRNQ